MTRTIVPASCGFTVLTLDDDLPVIAAVTPDDDTIAVIATRQDYALGIPDDGYLFPDGLSAASPKEVLERLARHGRQTSE